MKRIIYLALSMFFVFFISIKAEASGSPTHVVTTAAAEITNTDEASGEISSIPVGPNEVMKVITQEENRILVEWNNNQGYVLKEFVREATQWDINPGATLFKPTVDAPVFFKENGKYIKRARLITGQTFEKIGEENGYLIVQFGYYKGYIKKSETTPVINGTLPRGVEPGTSTRYKRVVSLKTASFYYSSNHQLVPFGRIEIGIKVPLLAEHRHYYIVEIAGRKAYMKKSEVSLYTGNYVNPKVVYTYDQMLEDFKELTIWYPGYTQQVEIGRSVDGRRIYAFKLGMGKEEVFLNGSHHAREHMTTNVLMEMIDQYAYAYQQNATIEGYNVRQILDKTSIWFVPMVNPDGVTLVQKGHKSAKNPSYVLKLNKNNPDFSAWKANVRGVDLNRQYPADWKNICCDPGRPGPQNYKGSKPLSEPEAQALYNFTLEHSFKSAAAYHSSGQIIYWHFRQGYSDTQRDKALATKISKVTGYSLVPAQRNPSGGGYTDWFIQHEKRPGFTPEISPYVGNRPVPLKNYDAIWRQNRSIGLLLANEKW
ncbi:M14 family metallopeptidase [Cytobacillus oceanisediminis]|uniref:M14 family metallopeptidase n=1 Tax=Cytobacillus oceanisediminis TaxID=665099 RepID=UPI0037363B2E